MRIAVLGTGVVGQVIAGRLAALGHEVVVGTRDATESRARIEPDRRGNPPIGAWVAEHADVGLADFADAARWSELVVNATAGDVSLAALGAAGAENLAGKIIIDIANPLDFSGGFPPTLFVKDTDSLGEQIQAAFPDAKVVKTLNTLTADLMTQPALLSGEHTLFMSGNDADAKAAVTDLLRTMGHTEVIDLGDISTARGTEMYLALWVRTMSALGTSMFNIKIVR